MLRKQLYDSIVEDPKNIKVICRGWYRCGFKRAKSGTEDVESSFEEEWKKRDK